MEEQFVPYDLALKLRKLHFNSECLAKYVRYNPSDNIELYPQSQDFFKGPGLNTTSNSNYVEEDNCTAPLWEQAFNWFEKKGYWVCIYPSNPNDVRLTKAWHYSINGKLESDNKINIFTKESARYMCLEKLIEHYEKHI